MFITGLVFNEGMAASVVYSVPVPHAAPLIRKAAPEAAYRFAAVSVVPYPVALERAERLAVSSARMAASEPSHRPSVLASERAARALAALVASPAPVTYELLSMHAARPAAEKAARRAARAAVFPVEVVA